MTMSGWRISKMHVRPQHYGTLCRSFFVPGTVCQALVLGCLAPCAQIPFLNLLIKKVAASILGATRSMNRTMTR